MNIPPGTNAIIVSGRPVENYLACGQSVPANRVVHDCLGCHTPVAISLQADEILRTRGQEPGIIVAGAMCPECTTRAAAESGGKPVVTATAQGEEAIRNSPRHREFFEELKKKAERP